MGNSKFARLLEPAYIGKVKTRNRMVKTAAQTYFFDSGERRVGSIAKAFYGALAKGGVGLIIVETPAMEWPLAEEGDRRARVDDDKYIKDLSELTKVVHSYGCPIFIQFYHRGAWGGVYKMLAEPIAASPVVFKSEYDVREETPPKAITTSEVEELIDKWIKAADRVAQAGFDGLEIHTAADTLLATFLSRFWNRRQDIYGAQNMENRTRLITSLIKGIKKKVGQDFPVQTTLNGREMGIGDQGITVEEAKSIAKIMQGAGVDSIHVRTHWLGQHQASYNQELVFYPEPVIPMKDFPRELDWSRRGPGVLLPLAAEIKKAVSIPVMTVGGLNAFLGENALKEGKVDLIGMTRPLFSDPEYPNKVAAGRIEDIVPCTYCGNCTKLYNQPRQCRINPSFGTDQFEVQKAGKKKIVAVVGGGPAGMEAAKIAALRGHSVTLYENKTYLGGSMPVAAMVKGLEIEDLPAIVRYFKRQLPRLGVDVKTSREFNLSEVAKLKPEVVIIASGGSPVLPVVPGIDRRNVIKSTDLYNTLKFLLRFVSSKTLRDLTRIWMPVGKRVVIIGGAIQGCQLAEYLVKRGRKVTIVDTQEELGQWLAPERKNRLFLWFNKKGVTLMPGVKLQEISAKGLSIITKDNQKRTIDADSIIPALPFAPDRTLYNVLKDKVPEVYAIGDCEKPGIIPDATSSGWQIANKI